MHRQPAMNHLADPVEVYIPMIRTMQTYTIFDLPRGKYIVCGEAIDKKGEVYQDSCLETRIIKVESKGWIMMMIMTEMTIMSLCRSSDWCAGPDDGLHGDDVGSDSLRHDIQAL